MEEVKVMLENFLRPEVLLSNVIVCLATFLITRWALKRKKKPQRQKETVQIPKQTADGAAVLEASLTTLCVLSRNDTNCNRTIEGRGEQFDPF